MPDDIQQATPEVTPTPAPAAEAAPAPAAAETPAFHAGLSNVSNDVVGYIDNELARHKELLTIVNALKKNVNTLQGELNTAGDKLLAEERTLWEKIKHIFARK